MTTSFDMQWDPEEKWKLNYKKVLPFVDVFLPNEQEILHLTKEDSISNALKKLSNVSNKIVVKMGSKGSLLKDKEKIIKKEPFLNKNVVDAIGAGDSFNAGFIFKFINGSESEECQEFGNLMGAVNTTAAGGTTAFKDYKTIMKIAKEKFGFKKK
jgi:sugar/nucleoside kinase (ribokinase family)